MRIVNVSAAVQHVQNLCRLSDSAEQRVIASLTLLCVVSHRRAFGKSSRGNHRTVKVHRHPRKLFPFQSRAYQFTRRLADISPALPRSTRDSVRLIVDTCGILFSPKVLISRVPLGGDRISRNRR